MTSQVIRIEGKRLASAVLLPRFTGERRELVSRAGERLIPLPFILQFSKDPVRNRFLFLFGELRDFGKSFFETGRHRITS
ncbi:MAG: hypothetical protein ACRDJE_19025 [Dehalococcoidia bacterium]